MNTTSDSLFPGTGLLSLREAIAFANFDSAGNSTITFDKHVFATPQTITLTGSQLELSNTTETETITGPKAGVTVSGGGLSRVFQVDASVTASISGLTITGGNSAGIRRRPVQLRHAYADQLHRQRQFRRNGGGGLSNVRGHGHADQLHRQRQLRRTCGGGLDNAGTATLTNCTVSGNSAAAYGGGLYNTAARLTLTNCTVSGNSACRRAAAAWTTARHGHADQLHRQRQLRHTAAVCSIVNGTATLTNCTVSGNSASATAAACPTYGTATLTNCTVSGNSANGGGGLYNYYGATATLTNCTVSGNSAIYGGGLFNYRHDRHWPTAPSAATPPRMRRRRPVQFY